jgi:Ca2+-binding RTX toxin-like protein
MLRKLMLVGVLAVFAVAATTALAANVRGGKGDDVLNGTPGNDRIAGFAGNDMLNGLAGDDRLRGGKGADILNGGDGNDKLKGGKGADRLNGDAGDDVIDGRGDGQTADVITCGAGVDTVKADRNDQVSADCENVKRAGKGHGKAKGHAKPSPRKEDSGKTNKGKGDEHNHSEDGKPGKGRKA